MGSDRAGPRSSVPGDGDRAKEVDEEAQLWRTPCGKPSTTHVSGVTRMPQDFDDFLLKEYERISEAYFSTMNSIAQFIGFYLTVASVPAAAIVIFGEPSESEALVALLRGSPAVLGLLPLMAVSFVGTCLSVFVIALKHDAVLYARAVNGVRAYFEAQATTDVGEYLVLPRKRDSPSFSGSRFRYVICALATVNAMYALAGAYLYGELSGWPTLTKWLSWGAPLLFFAAPFLASWQLSVRQARKYGGRP